MSSVTREEIIGLLKVAACPASCDNGVVVRDQLHGEIEQCQFCFEREQAIAALQAAEPVAEVIHSFVDVDIAWCDPPSSGRPPAGTKLFTLPISSTKAQSVVVPNEHGKNRYGLDMSYFRNLFNRELNRPLVDFRPDELARVLARASRAADDSVMQEAEFQPAKTQAPEGWKLVPVEPTDHMSDVGMVSAGIDITENDARHVCSAMLDAAPQPAPTAVPGGWHISRTEGGNIIVQKSHVAGFVASEQGGGIAESTLYYLADDLLTASPHPAETER